VACLGERRGAYRVLVGKAKRKRPHENPRRKWEYNIKIDLQEFGWKCMDWIDLIQDMKKWRFVVNTVMKCHIP
jgi:hypothetical protein